MLAPVYRLRSISVGMGDGNARVSVRPYLPQSIGYRKGITASIYVNKVTDD